MKILTTNQIDEINIALVTFSDFFYDTIGDCPQLEKMINSISSIINDDT